MYKLNDLPTRQTAALMKSRGGERVKGIEREIEMDQD